MAGWINASFSIFRRSASRSGQRFLTTQAWRPATASRSTSKSASHSHGPTPSRCHRLQYTTSAVSSTLMFTLAFTPQIQTLIKFAQSYGLHLLNRTVALVSRKQLLLRETMHCCTQGSWLVEGPTWMYDLLVAHMVMVPDWLEWGWIVKRCYAGTCFRCAHDQLHLGSRALCIMANYIDIYLAMKEGPSALEYTRTTWTTKGAVS